MKKIKLIVPLFLILFVVMQANAQEKNKKVDTRIDNTSYWKKMIELGYAEGNPVKMIEPAVYTGSSMSVSGVKTEDSPDISVNDLEQSEISVFVDPNDNTFIMNSNNSGNSSTLYGSNYFFSDNRGETWGGQVEGVGGNNSGDPATAISLDGRMYVGFIHSNSSQGVSYSADGGNSWTSVQAGGNVSSGMLDKNHLWIDNSASSVYEGNVYNVWSNLDAGPNYGNIEFVRTTNGGVSYSSPVNISSDVNAGSHDQGCNVQTGPNGEVYVVWSIYDSWPSDESALGFAKSTDGGATFETSTRIISNIKGIRTTEVSKNMRVNSFPSMSVDMSTGTIYVVWTNIGVPGTNSGTNKSIYMIKSDDLGENWSTPVRVNQGANDQGKEAYLPWMACDTETGTLSVVYLDDRNVSSTEVETYVSNSFDGGETWEDLKVSDVSFTPSPLPGMAGGYMGDYLGIAASGGMVYPAWCDNRTGSLLTYVSPFETNNRVRPANLQVVLTEETGHTELTWEYNETKELQNFVVYREGQEIGTTSDLFFSNDLPDYGYYKYSVSAMHDDGESGKIHNSIVWGKAIIEVTPESLTETLEPDNTSVKQLTVTNNGQLDLMYNLSTQITSKYGGKAYCDANGGGDEYISRVAIGDIDNSTSASGYGDYTSFSTDVSTGDIYEITVENGSVYSVDDLGIWVDWNQDEDFEDAGEEVVCEVSNSGQGTYEIIVPGDAASGATRMRIRIKYGGDDCGSPCGTTSFGEVEDYTLNVSNWLSIGDFIGTVAPGTSEIINVTFSSFDVELGTYNATISFESNDLETPAVEVPLTLIVNQDVDLNSEPTAIPQTVCAGDASQLYANAVGGTGTFTYSWTSDPVGFTSSEATPTVNPTEPTTYYVEVQDGENTVNAQVAISIELAANTPTMPTGSTYEGNQSISYYNATSDNATSYVWSLNPAEAGGISGDGNVGAVDWNNSFVGTAYVSVKAINDCGESVLSDELEIDVYDGVSTVEQLNNEITWSVYPNPSTGQFFLEIDSELSDLINIEIYSITGELVYSKTNISLWAYNSMKIDMTNNQAGLYLVHISANGVNEVKKLIIADL